MARNSAELYMAYAMALRMAALNAITEEQRFSPVKDAVIRLPAHNDLIQNARDAVGEQPPVVSPVHHLRRGSYPPRVIQRYR